MRQLFILCVAILLLSGCSGQGVLNTLTPSDGYNRASNLIYDHKQTLLLDVYTPAGAQNAPIVVFLYGGRWTEGSKDDYEYVGEALAAQGFVAVIPDYRKYPRVRFPGFVNDAAKAVKWIRSSASQYGGDQDRIFVMGHSAGAHIAAMLAVKDEFFARQGGDRSWLRGMIGLAGPYDFLPIKDPLLRDLFGPPEDFQKSQPVLYAEGDNPPMLLMHGEDDQIVWAKNTHSLAESIKKAGGPVETVIYPKMSHSLIVASVAKPLRGNNDVIRHVRDFVTHWSRVPRAAAKPENKDGIRTVPLAIE